MKNNKQELNNFFSTKNVLTKLDKIFKSSKEQRKDLLNNYLLECKKNYSLLANTNKNEYFYKNEYFKQIYLPKRLSQKLGNVILLNEWYINHSRLDLMKISQLSLPEIIEIKSDLDSLERLPRQLENYYSSVLKVSIFCSIKLVKQVLDLVPKETGILILDSNNKIKTLRRAKKYYAKYKSAKAFNLLNAEDKRALLSSKQLIQLNNQASKIWRAELTKWNKNAIEVQQRIIGSDFYFRKDIQDNPLLKDRVKLLHIIDELKFVLYFAYRKQKDKTEQANFEKIIDYLVNFDRQNF